MPTKPLKIQNSEAEALHRAVAATLPNPGAMTAPPGYPHSLALCILDAVWSIGVNYQTHVVPVLDKYVAARKASGHDASSDSPTELLATIDAAGGPTGFAEHVVENRQRTSTTNGILKAEAVALCCRLMVDTGIDTPSELAARSHDVESGWLKVKGQRSGISFGYLLILTGEERVKPDRMIVRFVEAAIGRRPTIAEADALVMAEAARLQMSARTLDHAMWGYQKLRKPAGRSSSHAAH